MVVYALFGVILGGRLGYVLFYKFSDYLRVGIPLDIVMMIVTVALAPFVQ